MRHVVRKTGARIFLWGALALIAALFITSACGSPAASGHPAPDFSVTTLEGREFTLSENKGKVVILDFLIANCLSCAVEIPALAQVYEQYKGRGLEVLVLDVSPYDTEADLLSTRDAFGGGDHLWALDRGQKVSRVYKVTTLGTTIVVDREGRIVYRDGGTTGYARFKEVLDRAL